MVTRVGKFLGGLDADVTDVLKVHTTENMICLGADSTPAANLAVVGNAFISTDLVVNQGIGAAGNTAPATTDVSLGTPANVVIRTHAASGAGNVIVGDATATSAYNLDVHGTANVGAFTTSGMAFPTSDGTEDYVLATDGSGALSWAEQTGGGATNPATALAENKDLGAVGGAETQDAFGVIITDNVAELDCGLYAADTLGTVDMGSVA
jgi:hypothetical protein